MQTEILGRNIRTFHPNLPPLGNISNDNHCIRHTSDRLQRAVPGASVLADKRPRNLYDLIVRATIPPLSDENSPNLAW